MDLVEPSYEKPSFTCPHCGAHAQQTWSNGVYYNQHGDAYENDLWEDIARSTCTACSRYAVWQMTEVFVSGNARGGRNPNEPASPTTRWKIIWPRTSMASPPHSAMPDRLKALYEESRAIFADSPRAAAALLRLLTETLLKELVTTEQNLNQTIKILVEEKRLSPTLQMAADSLRIIGNEAVHPAEIQTEGDTEEIALSLFHLVNLLVLELIAQPQEVAELYAKLPQQKREAVEKRDGRQ